MSVPLSNSLPSTTLTVEDFITSLKTQKISKGTVLEINGTEYIFKSVNNKHSPTYVFCEGDKTFTLPKPSVNDSSVPSNLIKTVKIFNLVVTNYMPQKDEDKKAPIDLAHSNNNSQIKLTPRDVIINRAEKILGKGGLLFDAKSAFVSDMCNHGFMSRDQGLFVYSISDVDEFKQFMKDAYYS